MLRFDGVSIGAGLGSIAVVGVEDESDCGIFEVDGLTLDCGAACLRFTASL